MDFMLNQWVLLQDLGKSNPVIAGAISLWGLGILTYLCRNIPASILLLIKRELTTTLMFDSSQIGTNSETFSNFFIWFEKTKWAKWSRSVSLNGRYYEEAKGENGTVVGVGDGTHFFMYKGRPFILTRSRDTAINGNALHKAKITGLTRNRKVILDLVSQFIYDPPNNKLGICKYSPNNDGWIRLADVNPRQLSTVIVNNEVKRRIIDDIQKFKESRQWYIDRGLSYKLVIVLHGLPGSGKTSFIKAIATHFNSGVSCLNFENISNTSLAKALSTNPCNNIVLVEDFDSSKSTKARKGIRKNKGINSPEVSEDNSSIINITNDELSLSSILNSLDGIISLDGTIIFMTTNVIESIDPAILRPGRVDHIYELGKLRDQEVREYISVMFPGQHVDHQIVFDDIMGCDLQKLYFEYRDNADSFIEAIPKVQ